MLVLTRKPEEKIVIGKDKKIVITILKIQGDKVSVGIKAPPEVPIYRDELLMREVEQANQQSAVHKQSISVTDLAKDLRKEIKQSLELEEEAVKISEENYGTIDAG